MSSEEFEAISKSVLLHNYNTSLAGLQAANDQVARLAKKWDTSDYARQHSRQNARDAEKRMNLAKKQANDSFPGLIA